MTESTVKIKLVTTADASGAQQINAALGITATREKELNAMRSQFMSAAEAEVAQVKKLAEESMKLAKAREAEAEAAKRRPLLADGIALERAEVEKLIAAQKQLATERAKPAAAVNPWASGGQSFNSRSPVFLQQLIDLDKAQVKAAASSRNLGQSAFIAANAFQDFAAVGLPGVTNQVGQLGQAVGMSAGLAGGLMVLAVLADKLGPKLFAFFDGLSTDKIKLDGLKALQDQLGLLGTGKDRATIAGERFERQLAAEDAALKAQMAVIKENVALFNLRNAAAQGAAEFEAQQKIEDIKAQGLPKEQEASLIAQAKIELLNKQAALQKEASDNAIKAAQEEAAATNAAAADAEQEVARLDEIIARTARLTELQQEQARLEAELAGPTARGTGFIKGEGADAAEKRAQEIEAQIAANKAAQAKASMGGLADASTPAVAEKARADAAAKAQAAAAVAANLGALSRAEEQKAANEAQKQEQERQRIAREAKPGVYNPVNLAPPPDPLTGIAPLPLPGLALPTPITAPPRDPLTGLAPLPGAGSFSQQPPNPLGGSAPQPLPQLDTAPLNNTSQSNDRANAAVLSFAQTVQRKNEELERKLKQIETQMKNSR
jgi:hypothetical protein